MMKPQRVYYRCGCVEQSATEGGNPRDVYLRRHCPSCVPDIFKYTTALEPLATLLRPGRIDQVDSWEAPRT